VPQEVKDNSKKIAAYWKTLCEIAYSFKVPGSKFKVGHKASRFTPGGFDF